MSTDLHGDTTMSENDRGRPWRIAAWAAAALLLLLPLVAGADWSAGDFVFAGVLLFGSLGLYELATRRCGNPAYRAGVGMALGATVLLVWANGAVGLTDSGADLLLILGVPAVGLIGAFLARFQARRMARAMFATALAVALIGGGALIAGIVPAFNSASEILGITGVFALLFVGSGLLFREAARRESEQGVA